MDHLKGRRLLIALLDIIMPLMLHLGVVLLRHVRKSVVKHSTL